MANPRDASREASSGRWRSVLLQTFSGHTMKVLERKDQGTTNDTSFGADAILFIGPGGSIDQANACALHLLSRTEEEVIGSFYGRYLELSRASPDFLGADSFHCDPVIRCLATEESCLNVMGLLRSSPEGARSFDGTVAPVYGESREVAGALLVLACESE